MSYDRTKIHLTTKDCLRFLADDIFSGIVDEGVAMNKLFRDHRPLLAKELEMRRADEVFWIEASNGPDIKKLRDYVETYDNEAPEYKGRHIDEANSLISFIANDDAEWYEAKSKGTVSAYRHYLDIYNIPVNPYKGRYVGEASEAIKIANDNQDWAKAKELNSIRSYSEYLTKYDNAAPAYVGRFVDEARQAILGLEDDAAWQSAVCQNTVKSYKAYLDKYDVDTPAYRGKYVEAALRKIKELQPPPPDPRIEDDNAWAEAVSLNTIEGYAHYLTLYKNHANEAELAMRHLIDEKAWKNAKEGGTISSYEKYLSICKANEYPGYEWAHVNAAKTQIGNLRKAVEANRKEEKRKRRIAEDNAAWEKARKDNAKHSYEEYLAKYRKAGGLHIREAQNAILKLQSDEDWENARAENTLAAYKRFVDKYEPMSNKYMSMHLPEAKKKVEELTQKPDPKPIKWKKWLLIILAILAIAVFLIHQRKCHQWPFGKKIYPPKPPITIVENVDSLQWAIDNHNISMLEKYANLDSMRAYFPLANELFAIGNDDYNTFGRWIVKSFNSPDSIRGRNLWDRYAQPIVDEMTKSITSSFNEIDWSNSDYAEKRCLSIYSSYVTNIESSIKLLQQPQQITSLENKAIDYLTSWERVKSKGNYFSSDAKLRYNEWRNLNDRLNFAISNKDELIRANYYKIKYDEK